MTANNRWFFGVAAAAAVAAVFVIGVVALGGSDGDEPLGVLEETATPSPTASLEPSPTPPAATATAGASPTAAPATATPSPTSAPVDMELSTAALLNGEYLVPDMNALVQFQDGIYHWVRAPGESESENRAPLEPMANWATWMDERLIASGDLDGDGTPDAAVILRSQFGGTGVFVSLAAVLNDGGMPVHVASAPLGDRVHIEALAVDSGEVVLDMLTFASPNSPEWAGQCCPTVLVVMRFRLQGTELVEVQ